MDLLPHAAEEQIAHFLRTGKYDEFFRGWPGENFFACAQHGQAALRDALIATVLSRTTHAVEPLGLADFDVVTFARTKVAPMVRGLFPPLEQEIVLDVLGRSVVFLTPTTISTVLAETQWLHTAWSLANLYLASFDAPLLAPDAPCIVGLSEATTCYVSATYWHAQDRFADFMVHEAAHVLHNCKRATIGLREIRRREWLLDIQFSKRETFAYACEAYSRIRELAGSGAERQSLLSELEQAAAPAPDQVDSSEYIDILREALAARNGWKIILKRCAPPMVQASKRRLKLQDGAIG